MGFGGIHCQNLASKKWAGLVQPPDFQPEFPLQAEAVPQVPYVWKAGGKGIGSGPRRSPSPGCVLGTFDEAAILTNDAGLVEPVRIVTQEVGEPVTRLTPINRTAVSLAAVATHVRRIDTYLGPCQFTDLVVLPTAR